MERRSRDALAKASSVSPAEAALVAKQLRELGIVRLEPLGKSYLDQLNERNYILDRIMKQILNAEAGTFDELLSILKRNLEDPEIISARVFGSIAKSEEKEDSDVDV